MRIARFIVLWWLALGGWWILLVGTNAGLELIAAACAGVLGAALALGTRRQRLLRYRFERVWVARTLKVPWRILRELAVVSWALALHITRVRAVRSAYVANPFPTGQPDAISAGRRAIVTLADAISPNTIPVDMDCERGVVLRHALDSRRVSKTVP